MGIIHVLNLLVLPFLALFCAKGGNRLSPFAQKFSSAAELSGQECRNINNIVNEGG